MDAPFKLGKKPARPGAVKMKFGTYFHREALPTPPLVFGHEKIGRAWGMFANDIFSDCVFAGAAHEQMTWAHEGGNNEVTFTDDNVLDDYAAVTGFDRNNPDTDGGTDMGEAAKYRRNIGVIDAAGIRHTVDSYVALNPKNVDDLLLATWLTGAIGIGLRFPDSAMVQFEKEKPWTVVKGARSSGGHYISCLSGDTKISLLDGRDVPISELAALGKDQWVYSIDEKHRIVPALATNIRQTGSNRTLLRVHLDDGSSFDCTEDHRIMRRNGQYVAAGLLSEGDSLMPLYRRLSDGSHHRMRGYEEIMDPCTNEWTFTHWRVTEEAIGRRWGVIHHIDINKRNNDPNNLERMSWDDHSALHRKDVSILKGYAQSEEGRQKSRELMTVSWADPDRRARHTKHLKTNIRLKKHRRDGFHSLEALSKTGKKYGPINIKAARSPEAQAKRAATWREKFRTDPDFRKRVVERARKNGAKAANPVSQERRLASWKRKFERDVEFRERAIANGRKMGRSNASVNHKIVRIERLSGRYNVYDLEVPKYHNFAIGAGVFVHNCIGRNRHGNLVIVTWGRIHAMTPEFCEKYCDEAIAYISLEAMKDKTTPEGFELDALRGHLSRVATN